MDLAERFWSKVDKSGDCWIWTAGKSKDGYGRIGVCGAARLAHRIAWIMERGNIPDGMTIDHLCRNRACQNVQHMELVTNRENVLRGYGPTAVNGRKTHCIRGHELSGYNILPGRGRHCRECYRLVDATRRALYRNGKPWHQKYLAGSSSS